MQKELDIDLAALERDDVIRNEEIDLDMDDESNHDHKGSSSKKDFDSPPP